MALFTLKKVLTTDTDYSLIEFHGELDKSSIDGAETQLSDLLSTCESRAVIFVLTDLKFINSEGVGFLVSTHLRLIKKNQQLILCDPIDHVADVLELVGIPKLLPVVVSQEEAVAAAKKLK